MMTPEPEGTALIEELSRFVEHEVVRDARRLERAGTRERLRRRERQTPQARARRRLMLLLPVLAAALAADLTGVGPFALPQHRLSSDDASREIHEALRFAAHRVEAQRRRSGTLPAELAGIGLDADDGWSYQVIDAKDFRVSLVFRGYRGFYDSGSGRVAVRPVEGSER